MQKQINPIELQTKLYKRYQSSQTYFYTNKINEIVREKRTTVNIFYEDVEYMLDTEQNFKRWYQHKEFNNKMFTFKEYYFYHSDCPRIFMKGLQDVYAKWQDKKRDLVYKRLKLLYKQSYDSDSSNMEDQKSQNYVATTHFLLQISDYNPFSKKYYLRVEAKKDKEKKRLQDEVKKNHSKNELEHLNHQLSAMLNDMSTLSEISTLSKNTPAKVEKERQKSKNRVHLKDRSLDKSKSKSTNMSNSNSIITFNFKKNKQSVERLKLVKDPKNLVVKDIGIQKNVFPEGRVSPRFASNHGDNNFLKSKSIFSVSSFGALHKNTQLKNTGGRYDQFKINLDSKKLTLDDRKYDTQKHKLSASKNIVIKTKSTSKFQKRGSLEKLPSRQSSAGRLLKADEFSDKKLNKNNPFEIRSRSMKSQYLTAGTTNKKTLFNIKHPLELTKGKKALELRNW